MRGTRVLKEEEEEAPVVMVHPGCPFRCLVLQPPHPRMGLRGSLEKPGGENRARRGQTCSSSERIPVTHKFRQEALRL